MGSRFTPPPILDHYDDRGALFLREIGSLPIPDFVKTASDVTSANKFSEDFALVVDTDRGRLHKFPLVDKGNTFLSALYFEKTAHALPVEVRKNVAESLSAALTEYGFSVPSYVKEAAALEKVASAPRLNLEIEYAEKQASRTEQEIVNQFAQVHPMARPEAARMLKEAGVPLPAAVACYARSELGSDFEAAIISRSRFVQPAVAEAMRDLVKVASQVSVEELANELYEIDQEFGLTRLYDTKVADPYRSILGTELAGAREKYARATSITIDNTTFTEEGIRELAAKNTEKIDDAFGGGLSTQLVVDPVAVLGSLPVPHQQALARILNDSDAE